MDASTWVGQPLAALDTPFLYVDLDCMERNIDKMAQLILQQAKVGWRPHTKAMKTPVLAQKLLAAGAHGITCAKLSEAEVMAAAGINDILVANQVVGDLKVRRLAAACRRADIMVAVDDPGNVDAINEAAARAGTRPRVLIEVDTGMQRAGVLPGGPALALARHIADLSNVRFAGLMTWESHALAAPDEAEKRRIVTQALDRLTDTAAQIRAAGIPVDIVSCGGTGTYWISAFHPGITEIEAGGGIYCDTHYRQDFGVDHEYALMVQSTVTSRPAPTRLICDAGRKAMSCDLGTPMPLGLDHFEDSRFSAEHGKVLFGQPSPTPRVGDRLDFVVGYSDTTVFLHDRLVATRGGKVEAVWELPGRGKLT